MFSSLTEAVTIHPPVSSAPFVKVELRATTHHLCPAVPLIRVDEVVLGVLHLCDVHVWAQAKDMGVMTGQHTSVELGQAFGVLWGPGCCERQFEVLWDWDPGRFLGFPDSREFCQVKCLPLSLYLGIVVIRYAGGEVVGVRQ